MALLGVSVFNFLRNLHSFPTAALLHSTGRCPSSLSPRPHFPFSLWGPSSAGVGGGLPLWSPSPYFPFSLWGPSSAGLGLSISLWFPRALGTGRVLGWRMAGAGGSCWFIHFVHFLTKTCYLHSNHFFKQNELTFRCGLQSVAAGPEPQCPAWTVPSRRWSGASTATSYKPDSPGVGIFSFIP